MSADFARPVTIAVTGTHSTGKSTFLQRLAERLRRDRIDVAIVADLGAEAAERGLPILDQHNWVSTLWIIARGMSLEAETWTRADVVLVDRPVSDALGYYEAALEYRGQQSNPANMCQLEAMVTGHVRNYDLILRTVLDPTIPLDLSKPRGTDLTFRALVDRQIAKVSERLGIDHDTLPANSHDRALIEVMAIIKGHLDGIEKDHRVEPQLHAEQSPQLVPRQESR
ncbi:AAA family ATPase [Nocardia barduliensis]|uniref:AAA family ATPase n=1 Tax=Nocardia barduliensis TaxID=2736643 RepID=UPI001573AAA1|nr:AAA family ATPase [Nocardia barduliensis]